MAQGGTMKHWKLKNTVTGDEYYIPLMDPTPYYSIKDMLEDFCTYKGLPLNDIVIIERSSKKKLHLPLKRYLTLPGEMLYEI